MDTSSEKEAIKLFIHTTWISDLLKQNRSSTSSKKLIVTNVNITSCNGTPLQYSCLENPADGAAWKAAVHGVTEGWTGLSDFTSLFTSMHWRRKWQPTPMFLPGESQGREPGGLLSMGLHRVGHD